LSLAADLALTVGMSVNFNVRSVSDRLLDALRRDPSLTGSLCDSSVDFDFVAYEQLWFSSTRPEKREGARVTFERHRKAIHADQEEALAPLVAAGLTRDELGAVLHLGRSWWGMERMIVAPVGCRLVAESEGEAIGEDVGYGPAHLLFRFELPAILDALATVTREEAEARFRVYLEEDHARRRAGGLGVPPPMTDEEFEEWSWQPFVRLRAIVVATAEAKGAVLRWYD